jgi:hypothetical protein
MSKMKDLTYDIEAMFIEGETPSEIALQLDIPLSLVKSTLESFGVDTRDIAEDFGDYQGA